MNFTQSFEEFSSGLGPTDLALYAGIGLVLWVLFKDKLSPVQQILTTLLDRLKKKASMVPIHVPPIDSVVLPKSSKRLYQSYRSCRSDVSLFKSNGLCGEER